MDKRARSGYNWGMSEQTPPKTEECQELSEKVSDCQEESGRSLEHAAKKPTKRVKNARPQGEAQTPKEVIARIVEMDDAPHFSDAEKIVIRVVNLEHRDIHAAIAALNEAQGTRHWTLEAATLTLHQAREKLKRIGEVEMARPNAYVVADCHARYGGLIEEMRRELERLPDAPMFAPARAKIIKMLADMERTRDDALQAYAPLPGTLPPGAGILYVSKLRGSPAQ